MRGIWVSLIVIAALWLAPAAAFGQAPTIAEAQAFTAWNARVQRVSNVANTVFVDAPGEPPLSAGRGERRAWADGARAWATRAQAQLAALEAEAASIPAEPPPAASISPEFRQALIDTRAGIPNLLSAYMDLAGSYASIADAVERGDEQAILYMRIASLEGVVIFMELSRDLIAAQAAASGPDNPQHYLYASVAESYEGFLVIIGLKRDIILSDTPYRALATAAADALDFRVQRMRAAALAGRGASLVLTQQVRAAPTSSPAEAAYALRVIEALNTFPGSYDRENQVAAELAAIAALLRQPQEFVVIEPAIDDHVDRFGALDMERTADMERRQTLLMGQ